MLFRSPRFLAVHVNHLASGDAARLARSGASVVHCPRSHAFFRHAPFPFAELHGAGVNLCLGTDSLATFQGTAPTGYSMNFIVQNLQSQPAGPEELLPVSQRRWIPRGDGTDGLELNLFTEMRAFAAAYPALAPEDILRMVTLNPEIGRAHV